MRNRLRRAFGSDQIDPRIRNGLVGCYLGVGSIITVPDLSGYGNHGSVINSGTQSMGPTDRDEALDFATADGINLGTNLNFAALTYSAWVNGATFPFAYNAVVDRSSAGDYLLLTVKSTGKLAVYALANADVSYDGTGAFTLNTKEWYHLACTYDSTAGLTGYVNGRIDGSAAANGPLSLVTTTAETRIGDDAAVAGREWHGRISRVMIYNRALSASEVALLADPTFYPIVATRRKIYPVVAAAAGVTGKSYIKRQAVNRASTF